MREGDKVKTTFWGIDPHGKDCLYQRKFLPFSLKNVPMKFQKVMDRMLAGFGFAKCYIDDIIILNLTPRDHMHHLREGFGRLNEHNLKLHPYKCQFFHTRVKYLGHMIIQMDWGFRRPRLKPFHRFPNQQMLVGYELLWACVITTGGL